MELGILVMVNISGTYVAPNLGPSVLPLPPEKDRAIITDFTRDAAGNEYVLYGKQGKLKKYNSAGEKVAEDDGRMGLSYPQAFVVSPNTGRIYVADTYNNRIVVYDKDLKYSVIVSDGVIQYRRNWNETQLFLPEGTFYKPTDIKIAPDGQVYVVDSANHRILRFEEYSFYVRPGKIFEKIHFEIPFKKVDGYETFGSTYSTGINDSFCWHLSYNSSFKPQYANFGAADGQFTSPESVTTDPSGYIYIADTGNNRIQVFNPDGSFSRKFGEGVLNTPKGIDIDSYGNTWVAEGEGQGGRIVQFDAAGKFIKEYKSEEYTINPQKIKVKEGKIYIADANRNQPLVWNIAGEISSFRVPDPWFSPNADSSKDNLKIVYNLTQPANVSVQVAPKLGSGAVASDAELLTAMGEAARGVGRNEEIWNGKVSGAQGIQASSAGTSEPGNFTPIPTSGQYTLKLIASFGDYKK